MVHEVTSFKGYQYLDLCFVGNQLEYLTLVLPKIHDTPNRLVYSASPYNHAYKLSV